MTRVVMRGGKLLTRDGKLTTCQTACCCPAGTTQRVPTLTGGGFGDVVITGNPANTDGCNNTWRGVVGTFATVVNSTAANPFVPATITTPATSSSTLDGTIGQALPPVGVIVKTNPATHQTQTKYKSRLILATTKTAFSSITFPTAGTMTITATLSFACSVVSHSAQFNRRRLWVAENRTTRTGPTTGLETLWFSPYGMIHDLEITADEMTFPTPFWQSTATWPPTIGAFESRAKNYGCLSRSVPCVYGPIASSWYVNDTDPWPTLFQCDGLLEHHSNNDLDTSVPKACATRTGGVTINGYLTATGGFIEYTPAVARCGNTAPTTADGPFVSCPNPATLPNPTANVGAGFAIPTYATHTPTIIRRNGTTAAGLASFSRTWSSTVSSADYLAGTVRDYVLTQAQAATDPVTQTGQFILGTDVTTRVTTNYSESLPVIPTDLTFRI